MASLVCQFVYAGISILGRRSNALTLTVRSSEHIGRHFEKIKNKKKNQKTKRIERLKSDKIFPFKWVFMCFCAQIGLISMLVT